MTRGLLSESLAHSHEESAHVAGDASLLSVQLPRALRHQHTAWTSFLSEPSHSSAGWATNATKVHKKRVSSQFLMGDLWPSQHLRQLYDAVTGHNDAATSSHDDALGSRDGGNDASGSKEHDVGGVDVKNTSSSDTVADKDSDDNHSNTEGHGGQAKGDEKIPQQDEDKTDQGYNSDAKDDGDKQNVGMAIGAFASQGKNVAEQLAAHSDDIANMVKQLANQGKHMADNLASHGNDINDVLNKVSAHGQDIQKQLASHSDDIGKQLGQHAQALGPDIDKLAKDLLGTKADSADADANAASDATKEVDSTKDSAV